MNLPKALILLLGLVFSTNLLSQKTIEPKMVSSDEKLEDVRIQPAEALEIAVPYLEEHATDRWNPDKPLQTHIVLKGDHYYISKTNYPAKSIYYYLQPAVKVSTKSGEVSFIDKNNTQKKKTD